MWPKTSCSPKERHPAPSPWDFHLKRRSYNLQCKYPRQFVPVKFRNVPLSSSFRLNSVEGKKGVPFVLILTLSPNFIRDSAGNGADVKLSKLSVPQQQHQPCPRYVLVIVRHLGQNCSLLKNFCRRLFKHALDSPLSSWRRVVVTNPCQLNTLTSEKHKWPG